MKNFKMILFAAFAFATLATSCKKDNDLVQPLTQVQCCDELDSVSLEMYLIDFDSVDLGNPNYMTSPWQYHSPYAITRCEGVVLDSMSLTVCDSLPHYHILNLNPANTTIPQFSFPFVLTQTMFSDVPNIKINKEKRTLFEIWDLNSSGQPIQLATFPIGQYGFYGEPIAPMSPMIFKAWINANNSLQGLICL